MNESEMMLAVEAALNSDWHGAHKIAQAFSSNTANWLHAVLHKIEGDEFNSRYWYEKTQGKHYEDFVDTHAELLAIQFSLPD